jgi:hypothetical protein
MEQPEKGSREDLVFTRADQLPVCTSVGALAQQSGHSRAIQLTP